MQFVSLTRLVILRYISRITKRLDRTAQLSSTGFH